MIKVGGRVGFDSIDQIDKHFEGIDFPIELALPHRVDNFMNLDIYEASDKLYDKDLDILSVHATQGNMLGDDFYKWTYDCFEFCDRLEINNTNITFHPNNTRKNREEMKKMYIDRFSFLENITNHFITIETFGGKIRVLRPEEIIEEEFYMTLDTSHLANQRIFNLIERYHQRILTVHLSGKGKDEVHQPIDDVCVSIIRKLQSLNWNGNIILEYMPYFHGLIREDIKTVHKILNWQEYELVEPDDKYRNSPENWGYNHK